MYKLDNVIQHYGVKGMKWGVTRNRNRPGGADGIDNSTGEKVTKRGKLGQKLDSLKRERQWRKVLKEMDKLSTKDISVASRRIGLENNLKELSKSKIGTPKDKQDYLRRADMPDDELKRKVTRLQAKNTLYKNINSASKEQRELGMKVARIGGSVGVKYALTKSFHPRDIFEAAKDPKNASNRAKEDILKKVPEGAKRDILKIALDKIDKAEKSKS